MARTIIVDEIKKDEAATAMSVDGVAKAWANFYQSSIVGSINVSSIVDNGLGDYTANYVSSMANAAYTVQITGHAYTSSYGQALTANVKQSTPLTVDNCTIVHSYQDDNSNAVHYKDATSYVTIHGDLA